MWQCLLAFSMPAPYFVPLNKHSELATQNHKWKKKQKKQNRKQCLIFIASKFSLTNWDLLFENIPGEACPRPTLEWLRCSQDYQWVIIKRSTICKTWPPPQKSLATGLTCHRSMPVRAELYILCNNPMTQQAFIVITAFPLHCWHSKLHLRPRMKKRVHAFCQGQLPSYFKHFSHNVQQLLMGKRMPNLTQCSLSNGF